MRKCEVNKKRWKTGIRVLALIIILLVIAAGLVQASISSSPNWTQESNQASAEFGASIRSTGDVNNDGFTDIVVNSQKYDNGQTDEGRVSLYYGTAAGYSTTPDWTSESNQDGALYGFSAGYAGDVNNDGYDDVIIGARAWDDGGFADVGKIYVYYGSSTGLGGSPNWTYQGTNVDGRLGISVGTAGDIDNDGYDDVIIGAQHIDNGQTDEGKIYVFHGSSNGLGGSPDWTYESNQSNTLLGTSVGTAGDVNNDGYDDVIVGAQHWDNGQTNEGRALVFHGSSTVLSASPNWTFENNDAESLLGYSVAGAGDVNGDSYDDVVVGAYRYGATDNGRVYVFYGSSGGLSGSPDWTVDGGQTGEQFGFAVASAGDVNADCYNDVIIGAPYYNNTESRNGRVYIHTGSSSGLHTTALWTYTGSGTEEVGYYVSNANNSPSLVDTRILVGAPYHANGQSNEGRGIAFFKLCE